MFPKETLGKFRSIFNAFSVVCFTLDILVSFSTLWIAIFNLFFRQCFSYARFFINVSRVPKISQMIYR
jgi:hypothetical protein